MKQAYLETERSIMNEKKEEVEIAKQQSQNHLNLKEKELDELCKLALDKFEASDKENQKLK
jgi:hypothetical protein